MEEKETLGQLLKSAREKKKLELKDIAQKTKININMLRYIEADDYNNLPNNIYVRGFTKSFAKEVGVNPEKAKELLEEHLNPQIIKAKEEAPKKTTVNPIKKKPSTPSKSLSEVLNLSLIQKEVIDFVHKRVNKKLLVIIILVAIIFFILKAIVNWVADIKSERIEPEKMKKVQIQEPIDIKPATSNILKMNAAKKFAKEVSAEREKKKEEIKKQEAKKKEELLAKEKIKKEEAVAKKEKATEDDKKKLPYKRFRTATNDIFTTDVNAAEMSNEVLIKAGALENNSDKEQNVFVYASLADSWLSFKRDDEKRVNYFLKKGKFLRLEANRLLLFIGNYNVTKVFYNGVFVKTSSKSGVKSLIFPVDKGSDYQLPFFPSYKGVIYSVEDYKKNMKDKP